ncbi:hypothetical protein Ccrd_006603 [Cynara cardunculus var. scolymus]|uniref:Uncharacterized protein n=1 Tax=Cynara cardunculus var. scolymus TaxID=59895 RepID=A0A124SBQ5_CYNCS|nr:hypothetical protein Ccrd_006603 [Cynara cardunculus var. scolymus]
MDTHNPSSQNPDVDHPWRLRRWGRRMAEEQLSQNGKNGLIYGMDTRIDIYNIMGAVDKVRDLMVAESWANRKSSVNGNDLTVEPSAFSSGTPKVISRSKRLGLLPDQQHLDLTGGREDRQFAFVHQAQLLFSTAERYFEKPAPLRTYLDKDSHRKIEEGMDSDDSDSNDDNEINWVEEENIWLLSCAIAIKGIIISHKLNSMRCDSNNEAHENTSSRRRSDDLYMSAIRDIKHISSSIIYRLPTDPQIYQLSLMSFYTLDLTTHIHTLDCRFPRH